MTRPIHLLGVDGNSIAHACHNAPTLSLGGFQVQAIFGMLRSLKALLETTPGNCKPMVLWDGRAEHRFAMYPEYKGNRAAKTPEEEKDKAALRAQMPFIELALKYLGVPQLRCSYLEADDLAAYLVRLRAGKPTTLVSGDKDWIGLVNETTSWFDPINDRRVDHLTFFQKTGYLTPEAYYEGKALQGDKSDNIPGIFKLGEKTAQLLLAKWGSFEHFFAACDIGKYQPEQRKSKKAASLHPEQLLNSPEGRAMVRMNLKLMDLLHTVEPKPGDLITVALPPDIEKFKALCGRLNFASILRDMPNFLRAFGITPTPMPLAA